MGSIPSRGRLLGGTMDKLHYFEALKAVRDSNQPKILHDLVSMQLVVVDFLAVAKSEIPDDAPLDLPFTNMMFELASNKVQIKKTQYIYAPDLLGVVERAFNQYTFYMLEYTDDGYVIDYVNDDGDELNHDRYESIKAIIGTILNAINKCKTFTHYHNKPLMVKKNRKKKTTIHLPPIIYIESKLATKCKLEKQLKTVIKWEKSFKSRGHWRRVKTIGKDREGIQCIKGYTWVKESVKGNGPMSNKIRVIK